MKKVLSVVLAFIMLLSMTTTAFAAENESVAEEDFCIDGVEVIVTYEADDTIPTFNEKDVGSTMAARAITTKDLGTSDSIGVSWTVSSESSYRSTYNYKTNSEKFVVKLKAAEQSTSVTLKCYNVNGTEVFAKTVDVWTWYNATFKITGLSYSNTYYFKIFNNDQHKETFTGTISAS